MQVSNYPSFFTNSESAFDADSFDTKITDFDENFRSSDSDGRPDFTNSKPEFLSTDTPSYINFDDSNIKHTPLSQSIDISNLTKPRLLPVGPVSDDKLHIPQMVKHHIPRDDTDSRIKQISQPKLIEEEEELEEPNCTMDSAISPNRFTEIILEANTHYNPISNDQSPNPQWIVITCDPVLIDKAPLYYNSDDGFTVGALVPRVQLFISAGQPILDLSLSARPVTRKELEDESCEF